MPPAAKARIVAAGERRRRKDATGPPVTGRSADDSNRRSSGARTRGRVPTGSVPLAASRGSGARRLERGRPRTGVGGQRRLFAQDRRHRLGAVARSKGAPARGHLVEHAPEREDVGPRVGRLAGHLLGRHVADRAHHRPRVGPGERRLAVRRLAAEADIFPAREAEVEDLHVARPLSRTRSRASGPGGRCPCRARRRDRRAICRADLEEPLRMGRRPDRGARAASRPRAAP